MKVNTLLLSSQQSSLFLNFFMKHTVDLKHVFSQYAGQQHQYTHYIHLNHSYYNPFITDFHCHFPSSAALPFLSWSSLLSVFIPVTAVKPASSSVNTALCQLPTDQLLINYQTGGLTRMTSFTSSKVFKYHIYNQNTTDFNGINHQYKINFNELNTIMIQIYIYMYMNTIRILL